MRNELHLATSLCIAALVTQSILLSQEFNAVVIPDNRRSPVVAEEIPNLKERKAFRRIFRERTASKRAKLAEAFLADYPDSSFLAVIHEIAAKAYIELNDLRRALQHAENSLEILPENPLLLVQVSNIQARLGLITPAREAANDALDLLERFEGPSSIPREEWPRQRDELQASAFFALGRVSLLQGLKTHSKQIRETRVIEAEGSLIRAIELNPEEPEISYLLGIVELVLGRFDSAADHLHAAKGSNGLFSIEKLKGIYELSARSPKPPFESFLDKISKAHAADHRSPSSLPDTEPTPSQTAYAGSEACRMCHAEIYRAWSQTGMAKMFRPYRPEDVLGDFDRRNEYYADDEAFLRSVVPESAPREKKTPLALMIVRQGRHYIKIVQSDGKWHSYPVDYIIGSKWQQAYATRLPNGRIHVLPIQYSVLERAWINFWKIIDSPGSPRANPLSWGQFDASTNYQFNCAACHTSQLRNTKGRGFELDNLEFREGGVGCEMCHGPSVQHVLNSKTGEVYPKSPLQPPVNFRGISPRDYDAICAQCHMQSAIRIAGPHGGLNFSQEGAEFFLRSKSRPYAEFSRKAFYRGGRFRQTTFIVESLRRTTCWRKGRITCGHCHDPHPLDAPLNPTSLKFKDRPDQMCLQCHSRFKIRENLGQHTGHQPESEGSRCISCHMPRIMEALLFRARTHRIDDVPDAEMTLRFGKGESPNACLLCHLNETALWVRDQLSLRSQARSLPLKGR